MTETKHTPGPWRINPDRGEICPDCGCNLSDAAYIIDRANEDVGITTILSDRDEAANASLIAAAPDLLHRLEESTKSLIVEREMFHDSITLPDGTIPDEGDRQSLAEADAEIDTNQKVIAKAKGE